MDQAIQNLKKLKKCHICKEYKEASEFSNDKTTKDNLNNRCKACDAIKRRAFYVKNEKENEEWKKKNSSDMVAYKRQREQIDPIFKLKERIRHRTREALKQKGYTKPDSITKAIGCTPDELRTHMESLFQPGMTWENYGYGKGKWNVDHKIAISKFNLEDPKQFAEACNYTNLQPMWHEDNRKKWHY